MAISVAPKPHGRPPGKPDATPEQIAEIRRLRLVEKKPVSEVSRLTGFSKGVIGTYANTRDFTPEEEAVIERLAAGQSQIAIVRSLNRPGAQTFVSRIFRRAAAEGRLQLKPRELVGDEGASHRDRVLAYLEAHPGEAFNSRDLAKAVDAPITKVEYAVDSLRKANKVDADKPGGHGSKGGHGVSANGLKGASGDHAMWFNVRLRGGAPTVTAPEPDRKSPDLTDDAVREAILTRLADPNVGLPDSLQLRGALAVKFGSSIRYFDLNRLLVSMERIGLIHFHREERGKRDALLTKIRITDAGRRSIGLLPRTPIAEPKSGPVERVVAPAVPVAATEPEPEPEPEPKPVAAAVAETAVWPILDALRARVSKDQDTIRRLTEAAALLEGIGDETQMVDALRARATNLSAPLSDVEAEYLAYARRAEG